MKRPRPIDRKKPEGLSDIETTKFLILRCVDHLNRYENLSKQVDVAFEGITNPSQLREYIKYQQKIFSMQKRAVHYLLPLQVLLQRMQPLAQSIEVDQEDLRIVQAIRYKKKEETNEPFRCWK